MSIIETNFLNNGNENQHRQMEMLKSSKCKVRLGTDDMNVRSCNMRLKLRAKLLSKQGISSKIVCERNHNDVSVSVIYQNSKINNLSCN